MALIGVAALLRQDAGNHTAQAVRQRHGRDLTAGEDKVAHRDFLVHALVQKPLINAFVVAADQDQMVMLRLQLPRHLLGQHPPAGGHIDGVYPPAGLVADMLPAAVQRVGLHHRAPPAAVGVIIHLHLLVGGELPNLVGTDGDEAPLLRPPDDGGAHHGVHRVGEQGHDINPHRWPILSSCGRG